MHTTEHKHGLPKAYYFLTPVWGESYTQLYLDTVIPTQLAPGNLPAFADSATSRYIIFTTEKDAEMIRSSPIFSKLSEVIAVDIEMIPSGHHQPHDLMSICHKRGIALADAADAAAFFLNPDLVFADGSFQTARRLAEAGTDVLLITGIRTLKQGVVRALAPHQSEGAIRISARELMRVALDNLHPMADASWWEEKAECDLIPANLYWRVGNEGLVARCFHLHPLMVYPQYKNVSFFGTVDDDYVTAACPDVTHDYVVTDSDELLAIELSAPNRNMPNGLRKESIDDCVLWAEQATSLRHRRFFQSVIAMHTGMTDTVAWESAKKKAAHVAAEINARLALPARHLARHFRPALKRRIIRWVHDRELARRNQSIHPTPAAAPSPAALVGNLIARMLGFYFRLARRLSAIHTPVKQAIFGSLCAPYPWTWGYTTTRRIREQMRAALRDSHGEVLVVTHHPARSIAGYLLHERARFAMFMDGPNGLELVFHHDAQTVPPSHYSALVVELPASAATMAALNRVLAPKGKLIALTHGNARAMDGLLAPSFHVSQQQTIGHSFWSKLGWRMQHRARIKVPFIIELIGFVLFLPFTLLLATLVTLLSLASEHFTQNTNHAIASLTIATRSDAA